MAYSATSRVHRSTSRFWSSGPVLALPICPDAAGPAASMTPTRSTPRPHRDHCHALPFQGDKAPRPATNITERSARSQRVPVGRADELHAQLGQRRLRQIPSSRQIYNDPPTCVLPLLEWHVSDRSPTMKLVRVEPAKQSNLDVTQRKWKIGRAWFWRALDREIPGVRRSPLFGDGDETVRRGPKMSCQSDTTTRSGACRSTTIDGGLNS